MEEKGLSGVKQLMDTGFSFDKLELMARLCREEEDPGRALTAYVLHNLFRDIAKEIGDGPVLVSEVRKLEAKYRTTVNLALEEAVAGATPEKQMDRLSQLALLHWGREG